MEILLLIFSIQRVMQMQQTGVNVNSKKEQGCNGPFGNLSFPVRIKVAHQLNVKFGGYAV